MQPLCRYCLIVLISILTGQVVAKDMAGITLKEVIRLSPELDPIRLNGASVKRRAGHDIYVGGLYLEKQIHSLDELLADKGPKRFLFYCKASTFSPETLIRNLDQGITINNSPEIIKSIEADLKTFGDIWKAYPIHRDDEIWIDYIPSMGTRVSMNGTTISEIKGSVFYEAFLRAWFGDYPVNPKFKKAMLNMDS